jgi:hypothetical protein
VRRGLPRGAWVLEVDTGAQELTAWRGGRLRLRCPVSTSRYGIGSEEGSEKTPPGWHEVAERIGHGEPAGRVFEHRQPQPRVVPPSDWSDDTAGDLILTRVLRLRGLEPGVNAGPGRDSYQRLIYLHGTAQEHRLGAPASHGCIRMANRDVLRLARLIAVDPAWCWIGSPPATGR